MAGALLADLDLDLHSHESLGGASMPGLSEAARLNPIGE
jgi:hypothetical protein